jgi:predicted permease
MFTGLWRQIVRHRGYYGLAAATLSLAVGANLVVFTVVNALWLRPLPFSDVDRLVVITSHVFNSVKAPALGAFAGVAGQVRTDGFGGITAPTLTVAGVAHELEVIGVTPEYFSLLGVPIRGRDFKPEDDQIGNELLAVVSHRLWSRDFGNRDSLIGSVLDAAPYPLRVIGVAPPDFHGARRGEQADVWVSTNTVRRLVAGVQDSQSLPLITFAKLQQGETFAVAAQRLNNLRVNEVDRQGIAIVPLKVVFGTPTTPSMVISDGTALVVVSGLALLVLLGGCATLSALIVVHYERRRRDHAVKLALGASPSRLVKDLAQELSLIFSAGMLGAILVAIVSLRAMPATPLPGGLDLGRLDLSMDWRAISVATLVMLLTLVVAGWIPGARAARANLVGEFSSSSTTTAPLASHRLRQGLLALHVCTMIVVLIAAGLFVRAVGHGFSGAPGFDIDRTAFISIRLPSPRPGEVSTGSAVELVAKQVAGVNTLLSALPGIEGVVSGASPVGSDAARWLLSPTPVESGGTEREMLLGRIAAGATYLSTLAIPILSGRELRDEDAILSPSPTVVTRSMAQSIWPDQNPIGQEFTVRGRRSPSKHIVVGVARDFAFGSLSGSAAGVVVTASRQSVWGLEPRFAIRSTQENAPVEAIRAALLKAFPDASAVRVQAGRQIIAVDLGRQRLGAWFFSGFGLTAFVLGIGGTFGLVAYSIESRKREFSVRLALGATPGVLVKTAVAAALVPVSIGLVCGLVLSVLVTQLFASFLVGLGSVDTVTYSITTVILLASTVLASLIAARPVRRFVPAEALKRGL